MTEDTIARMAESYWAIKNVGPETDFVGDLRIDEESMEEFLIHLQGSLDVEFDLNLGNFYKSKLFGGIGTIWRSAGGQAKYLDSKTDFFLDQDKMVRVTASRRVGANPLLQSSSQFAPDG